jgi:hypothetical protein
MEFVDSTGKLVEKGTTTFSHLIAFKLLFIVSDVPVPCFKPHQCTFCGSPAVQIE